MGTKRVDRAVYAVFGHNLVTGYIMGLNTDGTRSVRSTVIPPDYKYSEVPIVLKNKRGEINEEKLIDIF